MKKYFFIFLVWILLSCKNVNISYAAEDSCPYTEKINTCIAANADGTVRQIEDFLCIADKSIEKITYQIILDEEFKNDKIDIFLTQLETNKNQYFWKEKTENFIDGINEIERNFAVNWEYWREFNQICWISIVKKVQSCQWWTTTIDVAKDFFRESKCMDLVKTKLHISRQVAYNILMLNKQQVLKDEQKKYVQQERSKYDKLLDAFRINLGYLQRILHKWPSKITNPK